MVSGRERDVYRQRLADVLVLARKEKVNIDNTGSPVGPVAVRAGRMADGDLQAKPRREFLSAVKA